MKEKIKKEAIFIAQLLGIIFGLSYILSLVF